MNVLITGSTGQLGKSLIALKPSNVTITAPTRKELDLSNIESCYKTILEIKGDWIINCGAYTAVDKAEIEIEKAKKINGFALKGFTEGLNKTNGNILQISTDFVFNGKQNFPYLENQNRSPLNVYGVSKSIGEEFIENNIKNKKKATILRTSWVISPHSKNFVLTILKLHSEKKSINVVCDQIGVPTSAKDLAKVCWRIIQFKEKKNLPLIMQWSDAGVASWYDLAVAIGEIGLEIGLLKKQAKVFPIKSSQYPTPAIRPKYSILDTTNTSRILEIEHTHWRVNLKKILLEYKQLKN
mgnify:FL=1